MGLARWPPIFFRPDRTTFNKMDLYANGDEIPPDRYSGPADALPAYRGEFLKPAGILSRGRPYTCR